MKQKPIMPKEHFDAIAAQLGNSEDLKSAVAATRRTEPVPKHETPKVIEQNADYKESMKILEKNGLRPLTYQEALIHLTQNPDLMKQLKGKWFYPDGQGIEKEGTYTFNNKGELVELTGSGTIDQKVRVWPGNRALSLYVFSDHNARDAGWRFYLNGFYLLASLNIIAPVVVGIPKLI